MAIFLDKKEMIDFISAVIIPMGDELKKQGISIDMDAYLKLATENYEDANVRSA